MSSTGTSNSHLNTSSSPFQTIFDVALNEYSRKTGKAIDSDPLTLELRSCRSSSEIYEVLQEQAQKFDEFRNGRRGMQIMRKLEPTVDILIKLSNGGVLGDGIGLVFPPAKAIVAGIGILLAAAKDVSTSYDALMDLFECLGNYLRRLGIFSEIPPAMEGVLVNIMVELLGVLALATRQIKQGRLKKFAKKLLGENDVEAVLHRLDRLTMEESRLTEAQTMEISTRTMEVSKQSMEVSQQSMEVVRRLFSDMRTVMEDGRASTENIQEALVKLQEMVESVNKMKRDELQRAVRQWLSPPDPSINHNIACEFHHEGTGTWFTEGDVYKEWKAGGSFAWLHGKPGSGKSVLCSSIIKDLEAVRKAGLAHLAYYYFDFKHIDKQDLRGLLSSLLLQLTARSDRFYEILNQLYEDRDKGSQQPSERDLIECLLDMLALRGQGKVYIAVDAVDECPNNSGMPTSREKVLKLVNKILSLKLPHVRICVTSRPEVDIQASLERLTSHCVSLHDESGQRKDIINYIKHTVDSDPKMRMWRDEDKQLVINTLAEKAQGMFRWVYCQLDTLRRCFPGSIRRALSELPRTLDQTYERILQEIEEEKWEYALRLFQCLTVARRPLEVKELAEVLAVELDAEGTPRLNVDLRPPDADEAVLSACSTLVAIIEPTSYSPHTCISRDSWVVQFSHYSVKEFLTSSRLQSSRQNLSRFYISPEPAHTILAQSCISTLVRMNGSDRRGLPLANYALQHSQSVLDHRWADQQWLGHAQVDGVAPQIRIGLEALFDPGRPHFKVWASDLRTYQASFNELGPFPLSYASLYGFNEVVEYLVIACRQDTNATDTSRGTPLFAAQRGGHVEIARFLLGYGADVDCLSEDNWTPLFYASRLDFVQLLLEWGANVSYRDPLGWTPLHEASIRQRLDVIRLLINSGADINSRDNHGKTPLHSAAHYEKPNSVILLVEQGAYVNAQDDKGLTPLHEASENEDLSTIQVLINLGADINMRDNQEATPLHRASRYGRHHVAQLLIEQGVDVDIRDDSDSTPLHRASERGSLIVAKLLLNYGADIKTRDNQGASPLHKASRYGRIDVVQFLLDHGADITARDNQSATLLHVATRGGDAGVVRLLLNLGMDVNGRDSSGSTPLHEGSESGDLDTVQLLLNCGADINARDNNGVSPLHKASLYGNLCVVQLLLRSSVAPDALDGKCSTPLHQASRSGHVKIVEELLLWGADVDARDNDGSTPLWEASVHDHTRTVEILLERPADVNARNNCYQTALHTAASKRNFDIVWLLLQYFADPNAQDGRGCTPLHVASAGGYVDIVNLLLGRGANVNSQEWQRTSEKTQPDNFR